MKTDDDDARDTHTIQIREYAKSKLISDSEEAVAYWFLGFVVLLIAGGLLLVVAAPVINGVTDAANTMIEAGMVSEQTANSYTWCLDWWAAIPLILLIGLFIGAILKGQEERR